MNIVVQYPSKISIVKLILDHVNNSDVTCIANRKTSYYIANKKGLHSICELIGHEFKLSDFHVLDLPKEGKYSGHFKSSIRHGKGILEMYSNSSYEGDWLDDKYNGKGIFKWSDGAIYEGDWVSGKRTGKGVYTWANGTYEGDWLDDKYNGKGIFKWTSGAIYEGDWFNGRLINFEKDVDLIDPENGHLLVTLLCNQGDLEVAKLLCNKVLEFREKWIGLLHTDTLNVVHQLRKLIR